MQVRAAGGVWRDVGRLPEAALAQQIRQDEIDILVELTGTGVVVGQQMAHTHAYMTIGTQKSVACCCCGTHVALGGEVEAAWSRTWSQACVYLHAPAALHALSLHVYAFSAACCLLLAMHDLDFFFHYQVTLPTTAWACVPCARHQCK